MNYFLDTSTVVAVLRNRPETVRGRLRRVMLRGASISISSVVLYELWYGVERTEHRSSNTQKLKAFLAGNVQVAGFDEEDAAVAGQIRASLEAAGQIIGPYDLMIAAQALRRDATLITANTDEFAQVRGLNCQDWTRKHK